MKRGNEKILVHICCAPCASYALDELIKKNMLPVLFFYNPEVQDRDDFDKRKKDVMKLAEDLSLELLFDEYDGNFIDEVMDPYKSKSSIKYINDPDRYRRKRCNLCLTEIIQKTRQRAKKEGIKHFTTTFLCSPFKPHQEITAIADSLSSDGMQFYYQDFRKGYWKGRNIAKNAKMHISKYCGCADSQKEGRIE